MQYNKILSNNTSLSENWNEYRDGQRSNTRRSRVLLRSDRYDTSSNIETTMSYSVFQTYEQPWEIGYITALFFIVTKNMTNYLMAPMIAVLDIFNDLYRFIGLDSAQLRSIPNSLEMGSVKTGRFRDCSVGLCQFLSRRNRLIGLHVYVSWSAHLHHMPTRDVAYAVLGHI